MSSNPYAPPRADLSDAPSGATPALWNPGAAVGWSLLFGPVFGAWVQMINWRTLGDARQAAVSQAWVGGSVLLVLALSFAGLAAPESGLVNVLSRVGGLALNLTWIFASGVKQVAYVKGHHGTGYTRKGWGLPILWTVVAWVVFLGLLLVVGELAG